MEHRKSSNDYNQMNRITVSKIPKKLIFRLTKNEINDLHTKNFAFIMMIIVMIKMPIVIIMMMMIMSPFIWE